MVYADSVSAVSRDGYKFSAHPEMILGFAKSFEFLETVPCDVLITAHPDASDLLGRREKGNVVDAGACKRLAEVGKDGLKDRLVREAGR
jgi:metallo-beta-lactamase class B